MRKHLLIALLAFATMLTSGCASKFKTSEKTSEAQTYSTANSKTAFATQEKIILDEINSESFISKSKITDSQNNGTSVDVSQENQIPEDTVSIVQYDTTYSCLITTIPKAECLTETSKSINQTKPNDETLKTEDDANPNTSLPYCMMYNNEMKMLQFVSNSGIYLKDNSSGFEVCYVENYLPEIDIEYLNNLLTNENYIGISKHVEGALDDDLETNINVEFYVYYADENFLFAVCANNLFSNIPQSVYSAVSEETLYTLHCFQPEKWQWSDEAHKYPHYA